VRGVLDRHGLHGVTHAPDVDGALASARMAGPASPS
jgi:hypothetical protein